MPWQFLRFPDYFKVRSKSNVKHVSFILLFAKFQIMDNKFQPPAVQKVSETDLDHYTRQYLQTLVDHNVLVSWINFVSLNDDTLEKEKQNRICYRGNGNDK